MTYRVIIGEHARPIAEKIKRRAAPRSGLPMPGSMIN